MATDGVGHGPGVGLARRIRHHEEVGAPERGERLAQHASGEEPLVPPGRPPVDDEDLQALVERPVLGAVVQHDDRFTSSPEQVSGC